MTTIRVATAAPYDVEVGRGILDRLPALLGPAVQRVALVHAPGMRVDLQGFEVLDLEVPEGEAAKTAAVVADCWERLGAAGFTRSDAVVTVGGGATTDLGGFVAATWLRGVRVVHVPTSLLGMVDAAVGGKTGIDTGAGKNLVGSFHEPAGVLCDLSFLETLPAAELISGLGEVVKCGFIADPEILALVEKDPDAALDPTSEALAELVERAVRVKAEVVAMDLRETGGVGGHPGREVLNYGHTLGHAIEKHSDYTLRHGEAVAIGMVYVAELARLTGRLDDDTAARHARVLRSLGLPTSWSGSSFDDVLKVMRVDKKTRGAMLRFVILEGLAQPAVLADPSDELLRAAYEVLS
ncbi:MAG TPA: 3-dehydroquinate synthase [Nocardioides bacterium]|uniref:3-dehydroquinate synthase n=1 Tax=uncultured Nocardioides sp. TaxID=198441 RepID=UPI000EE7827E|nr:3-dehydroquinate synthase [uncultured Nocardioides sp.]HCB06580.1 3-dehydroquinate synthase [Nocardioides sp.]HRD62294.1 3-dehydroquinate synthase [Nocardioides sp.]